MHRAALAAVLGFVMGTAMGQTAPATAPPAPAAQAVANPADVKSMDAIIAAVYQCISGPAGQPRDWNRFRSLFVPGARLIPYLSRKEGGYSTAEYIQRVEPIFAKEPFYEKELARRLDQWAHIAQVFSTYESRRAPGEKPFARGINSIQLMNDGGRWWIVTIFWEAEDKDNPLPEAMLKSAERNP